jgi:hypothetical protein
VQPAALIGATKHMLLWGPFPHLCGLCLQRTAMVQHLQAACRLQQLVDGRPYGCRLLLLGLR